VTVAGVAGTGTCRGISGPPYAAQSGSRRQPNLYTDVWLSTGEPEDVWDERIDLLLPYQVNAEVMRATGNPAVQDGYGTPQARPHGHSTVSAVRIVRATAFTGCAGPGCMGVDRGRC
jgi:hypothetical protein